jgi:hypothetical protein
MVIGNLFLMNLFLAILLKNFEQHSTGDDDENQEEEQEITEEEKNVSVF